MIIDSLFCGAQLVRHVPALQKRFAKRIAEVLQAIIAFDAQRAEQRQSAMEVYVFEKREVREADCCGSLRFKCAKMRN